MGRIIGENGSSLGLAAGPFHVIGCGLQECEPRWEVAGDDQMAAGLAIVAGGMVRETADLVARLLNDWAEGEELIV